MANWSFGLWFPMFRQVSQRVRPEWLERLANATVDRAIWAREPVREAILDNMARVLQRRPTDYLVEEMAREMLANHSRAWIDFLRYTGDMKFEPSDLVARRMGTGHLLHARDQGRGAILLTAHVGNFELGGVFLRELGLDVSIVYMPDPSPVVEKYRKDARERVGMHGIPVTTSPLSFVNVLRALEGGGFVALQGDRDVSGTGRRMPFLGRTASFPVGPFKIAAASGAPLLPVFILQEPDWRYQTIVEEPIRVSELPGRRNKEQAVTDAMAAFVAVLEKTIRAYPSQWYRFTRFWEH